MIRALDCAGRLDLLLPDKSLVESTKQFATYWCRFQAQYPQHQIFEKLGPNELRLTVPIKLHGDEGRSHWACNMLTACLLAAAECVVL